MTTSKRKAAADNAETVGDFAIRKSVFHCDEDGKPGSQIIDVRFNTGTLLFSAMLPAHVANYNGMTIDPEIMGDTAQGVIETYETLCDEYSRWRLAIDAPTQLWIGTYSMAGEFAKSTFGFTHACGIGATPVKALPNGQMIEARDDGSLGNPVGNKGGSMPVLIADKPEHRAKVASLAASIQQAADILAGLNTAVDPAEYLMSIRSDWEPNEPVQGELPLVVADPDDDDL
jgi:hypothetical protein